MAKVLVFDVIETLLDLGSLREPFARAFSDATSLGEWFARAAPRLAGCDGDGRLRGFGADRAMAARGCRRNDSGHPGDRRPVPCRVCDGHRMGRLPLGVRGEVKRRSEEEAEFKKLIEEL